MTESPLPPAPARAWNSRRDLPVILLVLLVNLLLVAPTLMRPFDKISPYDEAKYIDSGRSLTRGEVRGLDWGPLVAVVYAPLHLVAGSSPDWFLIEAWVGGLILFAFLWLSIFYLGTRLSDHAHPFLVAGGLFLSEAFFPIIENQSDALYLGFSALALGKVLTFHRTAGLRDLVGASVLVGLAALSRAEAILLLGVLPLVAVLMPSSQPRLRRAAGAALPALAVLGLFALASRASTGDWGIEFAGKSWESFEVNQPVASGGDPIAETHRLFGTGEENGYSVVRAAVSHPAEFVQRLAVRVVDLPDLYFGFFNKRLGAALAFLSAWGAVALLRKRSAAILWIGLLWAIPTATSLAFLVRHFVPQLSFLPFVLAPVGLAFSVSPATPRPWRLAFVLSVAVFALLSALDGKPAFLFAATMMLAVAAFVWFLRDRLYPSPLAPAVPLLLALAAGLLLRGPVDFPDFPKLGASPSEQAVHFLQSEIPPGSTVISFEPIVPIAARMEDVDPPALDDVSGTADGLCRWLSDNSVSGAVVNGQLRANHAELLTLMERMLGRGIERAFVADPATVEVWLVTQACG